MPPDSADRCNYPNIANESRPYEQVRGSTQLEGALYRRDVPEYVVVVERALQVSKGFVGGVASIL
jgi:hypothetical protein